MKKAILILIIGHFTSAALAQDKLLDSISNSKKIKFKYEALIIPTVLIGYGIIGLESNSLKNINSNTKQEFSEHIDEKITIDDFSQYSPFVAVYVLNAAGVKGKHNFRDRTIILATAYLIMGGTVNIIKNAGNEMRPDGTSNNSFPSGHTATAFMGAEFLYQEYKDTSIWYGVSGYAIAAGTGFFRMYNDRHWLSDVTAGAGIGILSTKIAYWLNPFIKKNIFGDHDKLDGVIIPTYKEGQYGIGMVMNF